MVLASLDARRAFRWKALGWVGCLSRPERRVARRVGCPGNPLAWWKEGKGEPAPFEPAPWVSVPAANNRGTYDTFSRAPLGYTLAHAPGTSTRRDDSPILIGVDRQLKLLAHDWAT